MTTETLQQLADGLYAEQPDQPLFHYTSTSKMMSIVEDRCLWATDLRYMSDAAELRHLAERIHFHIVDREGMAGDDVLRQFDRWALERMTVGHAICAVAFSAAGNLLSQWRAYCPPAKGVSLGFAPQDIRQLASEQSYRVGRCMYDYQKQAELLDHILDVVVSLATGIGPNATAPRNETYHSAFATIEVPLLQIAALFKHGAFEEEHEWRLVSPVITVPGGADFKYREGSSMLVPYRHFGIAGGDAPLPITRVFVGPTPSAGPSVDAVRQFLWSHGISAIVDSCRIPYRTW